MKVVDLHPEDLIDKLAAGELTPAEHERLDAHLAQCRVCRFEIELRHEFAQELPASADRPQLPFPGAIERTPRSGPAPRASASVRPGARRRWPLMMLAAALVLCAGGAAAAVLSGAVPPHWLPWVPATKTVERAQSSVKAVPKAKRAPPKPAAANEPETIANAQDSAVESAASLPQAGVVQPLEPAPALAATSASDNRGTKAAPVMPLSDASSSAAPSSPLPASEAPARVDPAAALFADANRARRDGNADRAVTLYRALQSRYPNSAESTLSRALLAQLLLDRGNPEAALAGFDRYLAAEAPVLRAEALVGRARALEQLGKSTQAATAWREVQSRFPGSVHARLAATRLAALGMQ